MTEATYEDDRKGILLPLAVMAGGILVLVAAFMLRADPGIASGNPLFDALGGFLSSPLAVAAVFAVLGLFLSLANTFRPMPKHVVSAVLMALIVLAVAFVSMSSA